MGSQDYRVDRRDLEFILFEQLKIQDMSAERFAEYDLETYQMILDEAAKLAESVIAPINGPGDRQGCRWVDGDVKTPDGYKAAYDQFIEAGWSTLTIPMEDGGQGLPMPLALAASEAFTGASPAFVMYPGLTTAAANVMRQFGTDWMKEHILPHLVAADWAGTMLLTEPQAGSAVGDASTTATPVGDGTYRLVGTKIFASGGDQDLTENIIHMTLARIDGAPAGIRGLSLFAIPKVLVNEDGSLGERNDVACAGIEHKMGINGSATAQLAIGENEGGLAWLIGEEGRGIEVMFHMMNEARIGVGVQSYSVAGAAYRAALGYAHERLQGTALKDMKNADARRVAIVEHPDVKRMLLLCRSQVDGMRALGLELAMFEERSADGDKAAHNMLEVLTPICKAWSSDQGFEVTRWALQVYGGYGYIGEYPAEQFLRDAKIFSIYEGTNGIQALDLIGRKMTMKGGMAFMTVLNDINMRIKALDAAPQLAAAKAQLEKGRDRLGMAAMHLQGLGREGADIAAARAYDMLLLFGDVYIGVLLGSQALHALPELEARAEKAGVDLDIAAERVRFLSEDDEARFYARKVDNLNFFAQHFMQRTAELQRRIVLKDSTVQDAVL